MKSPFMNLSYDNIFVVESIAWWDEHHANLQKDLVLTFDFALHKYINDEGGECLYIDHLVCKQRMDLNNELIYDFFRKWHFDENGNDLFVYKKVPFGFSFRLAFWNDFVTFIRLFICLKSLESIEFDSLYFLGDNPVVIEIMNSLNIRFTELAFNPKPCNEYYFPISKWMNDRLRPTGIRGLLYWARDFVSTIYGRVMPYLDRLFNRLEVRTIFIQEYHPTRKILEKLRQDKNISVLLSTFSRGSSFKEHLSERLLPRASYKRSYEDEAEYLLENFRLHKCATLILDDGSDISESIYRIIENRVSEGLVNTLRTLDGAINYLDKNTVDLVVLIANIGHSATLFDCVCKHKGIPSYLIINGLLGFAFLDESKHANYINGYSKSINKNYFRDMHNTVALGDPRMDAYSDLETKKSINRDLPTIVIGTSGFNSVSLNSYVALEFEFIHEVLTAISEEQSDVCIVLKVRPNGYREQYKNFCKDYFPRVNISIEDKVPMKTVLTNADLYISIYSQTLFEASCLGVPCIYYKNDNETLFPPFDAMSELVTAC